MNDRGTVVRGLGAQPRAQRVLAEPSEGTILDVSRAPPGAPQIAGERCRDVELAVQEARQLLADGFVEPLTNRDHADLGCRTEQHLAGVVIAAQARFPAHLPHGQASAGVPLPFAVPIDLRLRGAGTAVGVVGLGGYDVARLLEVSDVEGAVVALDVGRI